jgi:Skp family chaperone for outer membrane proteins
MTMKRRYLLLALPAVAVVAFLGAKVTVGQAGTTWPPTRAATIDLTKIFDGFQQTKDLNDVLQQRGDAIVKEGTDKEKSLTNRQKELEAFKPDSPDFDKRYQELMKQVIDFRAWQQFMREQVENEHRVWLKKTYQQILEAVSQIAGERGIDVVLYSQEPKVEGENLQAMRDNILQRKVVWSAKQMDITDQVLQRLNRDYETQGGKKSIKLPF